MEEGLPFFTDGDVSLWDFLSGTTWQPVNDLFGVCPLAASLYIAAIAAVVAIPLGSGRRSTSPSTRPSGSAGRSSPSWSCWPGMPTIVLGFFALDSVIPAAGPRDRRETQLFSALGAGIVVGVLITPLISSLSEDAMRAVPNAREGAYGVGATRRHVATRIVFPRPCRASPPGSCSASRVPSARRWPSRSRRAPSRTSPGT